MFESADELTKESKGSRLRTSLDKLANKIFTRDKKCDKIIQTSIN